MAIKSEHVYRTAARPTLGRRGPVGRGQKVSWPDRTYPRLLGATRTKGGKAKVITPAQYMPTECEHGEPHVMCCHECMSGPAATIKHDRSISDEKLTAMAVAGTSWDMKE